MIETEGKTKLRNALCAGARLLDAPDVTPLKLKHWLCDVYAATRQVIIELRKAEEVATDSASVAGPDRAQIDMGI